jgi:hypothetical protein
MGQWGSGGSLWGGGIAESLYPGYDVILGGVGLLLEKGGYERRVGQAYAAKLSTAGTTQNDRLRDELLLLDAWDGGEGYLRHEPDNPDRYRAGGSIDQFSEEGAVGLGPYMSAKWSSALNGLTKLLTSKGALFIGTSAGLIYSYTSGTPTLIHTTGKAGGIISFARAFGDAAYAGTGTDGVVFSGNTSVWVTAFTLSGTVTGVGAMAQHWKNGLPQLYMAAENSGGRCTLHTSNGATSAVYSAAVLEEPLCRVMIPYKRDLVVVGVSTTSRRSSIYQIDDSGAFASGFEQKLEVEGAVILCGAVLGDYLYLGDKYAGRIWRWDGTELKLHHQLGTPAVPYTAEIRGMVTYQGGLWVSILHTDGSVGVLRFDGSDAWSRPVIGLTGTTPEALAEFNGQLHLLTSTTGASKLWATDGTFGGAGNVESGLIDARLSGTDKLWRGVTIRHSALVSPQTVEVQYKLEDTGSWVSLGTSSTVGATAADFDFPTAITADLVAFKVLMTGTAGSSTALKVYSLSARYYPSPGAKKEWSVEVLLHGTTERAQRLQDGTAETRTGEELSAEVWALVAAGSEVNLIDLDRQEYTVQIAEYRENTDLTGLDGLDVGYTFKASMRLVEV